MIELFSADTPNGKKITIMLEEIGYDYKLTKIDLNKGEQFNSDFKKISPFSKIPVIIDHDNNKDQEWIIHNGNNTKLISANKQYSGDKGTFQLIIYIIHAPTLCATPSRINGKPIALAHLIYQTIIHSFTI